MENNDFAVRLKKLMKKRGISEQKIADVLNVSQKTISRYVTGETIPKEEKQKKVLQAVAEISGYSEDAELETPNPPMGARQILKKWQENPELFLTEDDYMELYLMERELDEERACQVFSLLEKKNKKHVIENLDTYSLLNKYEIVLVENFSFLLDNEKAVILDMLKNVSFEYEKIVHNFNYCEKIASYIRMISKCAGVIEEDVEKFEELPDIIEDTTYLDDYMEGLKKMSERDVYIIGNYLEEIITFDTKDWYFLTLIQVLSMKDQGKNLLCESFVGDRVYALAQYTQTLSDIRIKEEEEKKEKEKKRKRKN